MKINALIPILFLLISSCEKDALKTEWKCTEYKALFQFNHPTFIVPSNRDLKFYKVNDSLLFLYTSNSFSENDVFFKIELIEGRFEIIDCRALITGHIMDISFPNRNDGYLLVFDEDIDKKRLLYTQNGGTSWNQKKDSKAHLQQEYFISSVYSYAANEP